MERQIFVYTKCPEDFKPAAYATGAYILVNDKVLFLQLHQQKKEAYRWGIPAGKKEVGETPEMSVRREVFEETGIALDGIDELGILYIRKPEIDYIYHLFNCRFGDFPEVHLSDEHVHYKWVTVEEAKNLPLMEGALEALDFFVKKVHHC